MIKLKNIIKSRNVRDRCVDKQSKGNDFTSNSESNLGYGLRRKASAEQNHTVSGNKIVDITKLVKTINSLYTLTQTSKRSPSNSKILPKFLIIFN